MRYITDIECIGLQKIEKRVIAEKLIEKHLPKLKKRPKQ